MLNDFFLNPPKNDYDMNLRKYGPFQAIQNFIPFFVKVFLIIFFHLCCYCFNISDTNCICILVSYMVSCAITTFAIHLIALTLEKYGELQVVLATQNYNCKPNCKRLTFS